jgi:cytochrome c peroxidase
MRSKARFFLTVPGLVLVLVPFLLSKAEEDNLTAAASENPLRALIAQQSNLELFYLGWQKSYLAHGGDRNIEIPVAWTESLSTEPSKARGRVHLDLIDGAIRAEVRGLKGQPADLWLVDNQEGPGRTVQPEPGDRMIHVGRLRAHGETGTISADLAPGFFRDFELDLVVVSTPGRTPAESRLLTGARPFFERLYTRTRVARDTAREREARLLGPATLLALLSPRPAEADSTRILVSSGLVSQAVADGADLFFRETFGGNGRTCGTCHRAENNLGLDLDFISTLPARDKLFVAEHSPSEGGVPGLERPRLMRGHAQILMNSDGFENPTAKFVMRAVQHTLSLATSITTPDQRGAVHRTGWSGDAAPGDGALRMLPNAAVPQHFTRSLNRVAGTDFVLPTDAQLDNMEAFTLASGRLNELNLANVKLTDAAAQAGRLRFGFCNGCHSDAGATSFQGLNFNFNTGVERAPDPSQTTEPHPKDGGLGTAVNFIFDCDGDGTLDCFGDGSFNVPPLIEAADTEPFFHNHSAATLEDAVSFYTTRAAFQGNPLPLSETDVLNIGSFLRVLNAAFNSAISIQRNTAALTLEKSRDRDKRHAVNMLLALSNSEAADAIEVLGHRKLHPQAIKLLNDAISANSRAIAARPTADRQALIRSALRNLKAAKAQFGTGLDFTLGEGNLLF